MKSLISSESTPARPEDGPEEGEIVSDDLEDISDDSIIFTPCNGKSLSRSDHLHALSLSSVTDLDDFQLEKRRKRKKSYSQRHVKRRKRSRRKPVDSDSSDDDTTLDRRLKIQLKAAIRVDVEEAHKNSLRTRLRAMVHPTSGPESDKGTTKQKLDENGHKNVGSSDNALKLPEKDISIIEIDSGTDSVVSAPEVIPATTVVGTTDIVLSGPEAVFSAPENLESSSEQSKDDIDSELIHLRIEALKTALKNKFANKKRWKKDSINSKPSDDTNKENTNNNSGEVQKKKTEIKVEIPQISPQSSNEPENVPPSPEEDEDVLRALLLASMSKKITNIEPEPTKTTTNTVHSKPVVGSYNKVTVNKRTININNFKLNNVRKVTNSVKNVVNKASGNTKLIKMPQVKPLIISVNSDSDSDFDLSSSPEKSPVKLQKSCEKNSNDKEVGKNLEAAIETSVDKFLKEQRAKVESERKIVNKASLEKLSVVDTKKNVTVVTGPVVNSKIMLGQTVVTTNTKYTKNITLNANKTTQSTNQTNTVTNKNTHISFSTPEKPKNLKFAELEKSALKFLPENKREEYKKLQNLLKLRKAQLKKPRIRRISQKVNVTNKQKTVVNKNESVGEKNQVAIKNVSQIAVTEVASGEKNYNQKVLPNKNLCEVSVEPKKKQYITKSMPKTINNEIEIGIQPSKMEVRNQERRNQQLRVEARNQERKSDALLLHTTLKQMQTRKDGRLQIQERYKSLRPLIKKINDVCKEQKHWDQEVKKLLEQLAEARMKQQDVHESMSTYVKELAEKKQKMDQSLVKTSAKPKTNIPVTSTPLKQNIPETSLDISAVEGTIPFAVAGLNYPNQITVETNLIEKNKDNSKQINENSKKNNESKSIINNTWEQSTKIDNYAEERANTKVVSDVEVNVGDPNDIDKIIRKTEERVAVLEKKERFEDRRSDKVRYVSPLDSVKRKEELDPFAIMCPFEVNGTCKDSECTFKHLPK